MHEVRFGLNVSTSAAPGADPVADARRAEELGFDFVSANDHLHGPDPRYETWTMLSWIAAATTRIHVATRVLGMPYRNPAVVAKMAETFDRLSGGRLILGLGGGASDAEFRAFGLGVRSPREKVDALEEAVRIMRGMWTERNFTFDGRLYRTEGAEIEPKPARRIPIWLGTFGPRALAVTGRVADGWIPSIDYARPEDIRAMGERIHAAARDAGREPGEITFAYNMEIRGGEDVEEDPSVVSGSPERVVERLHGFVEMGFTAFNFIPAGPGTDEQVHLMARDIIPAVRAAVRAG
jgi:probable F420-dependent oxidoreductase